MGTMMWIGLPEPPPRDPTPSRDWLLDMPLIRELGRGAERPCKPLSPPPPSATERKHLPDVDVAAAGGWTETSSLKRCYQQADEATMLEVVLSGGQLRESRG